MQAIEGSDRRRATLSLVRVDKSTTPLLLATCLIYSIFFEVIGVDARATIAGVLGLYIIMRACVSWPVPQACAATFCLLGMALVAVFDFIFLTDPRSQDWSTYSGSLVRMLGGPALALYFACAPRNLQPRVIAMACVAVLAAAAFAALTLPPTVYGLSLRPAPFTGGVEGIHPSAYIATAGFVGVCELVGSGKLSKYLGIAIAGPLLILILLYDVRTCVTMILVYAGCAAYVRWRKTNLPELRMAVMVAIGLVVAIVAVSSFTVDFNEFSSGRTNVYAERFEILSTRPPVELMFGTGAGTEVLGSTTWWWAPKNSHNDFIDITIEIGIIGLLLYVSMLSLIATMLDEYQLPIYASFIASSLVSNGLLGRPLTAIFFLALLSTRPTQRLIPAEKRQS